MPSAPSRPLSRPKRALFWAILVLFLASFAWLASAVARGTRGYFYVKAQPSGWRGPVVRSDARLAVAPIAGSAGAEIIATGVSVPARFDADGFRVPLHGASRSTGSRVLAIGDSFTFGSGCTAEQTYPSLVAEAIHGRSLNAGYPGYGLAQMLVLARDLLPRHRPDVLLVQASTWLPARATRPFRRSELDLVPYPFFAVGRSPSPVWHPPLFPPKALELPVGSYRDTRPGLRDWISFQARVALPLFVHDDPRRLAVYLGRKSGRIPAMASEQAVSRSVYPEILRLCRESGTRMVVVVLEGAGKHDHRRADLALPQDVPVVDTTASLYAPLASSDAATYLRAYGHWRGSPPRLIDEHPNPGAHAIIARQVLEALSRPSTSTGSRSGRRR